MQFIDMSQLSVTLQRTAAVLLWLAGSFLFLRWLMVPLLPFLLALGLSAYITAQGQAVAAMASVLIGAVLNILLDPLFIFVFHLGIAGAAMATAISQMISWGILISFYLRGKTQVPISIHSMSRTKKQYLELFSNGFPSLSRHGCNMIANVVLNWVAGGWGDAAIAAMSIVTRFMMFINSSLIGFGQGFQPVCGFNFGAGRYDRVLEAYWFCVKVAVVMLTAFGAAAFILSRPIIAAFRREDLEVIRIGTLALRLQLLTMPIQAWVIMVNMLTQSIGYGFRASLVAMGRQGLFLIPSLLVFPGFFGVLGVQIAQPLADVFTFLLATGIVAGVLKELGTLKKDACGGDIG